VEVLVEGPSKTALKHVARTGPIQLTGRTPTDHIVVFEGNERLIGRTVQVTIEEATAFTLFGTVVTGEQIGALQSPEDQRLRPVANAPGSEASQFSVTAQRIGLPVVEA